LSIYRQIKDRVADISKEKYRVVDISEKVLDQDADIEISETNFFLPFSIMQIKTTIIILNNLMKRRP